MKIAGSITSFNRPNYLLPVLQSLEQAVESDEVDWYAFQDGQVNINSGVCYGIKKDVDACIKILKASKLNFKHIEINDFNECVARQKHKAHQLFNDYDLIYFFEDDLVISKYYLRLLRVLAEQAPHHVGMMNRHPRKKGTRKLNLITTCEIARLWGYYMTKQVYLKIEPQWNVYYKNIKDIDYRRRKRRFRNDPTYSGNTSYHDISLNKMIRQAGGRKLWPAVSRAKYIGKDRGLTYNTTGLWQKRKMHTQPETIDYAEDAKITRFKITKR